MCALRNGSTKGCFVLKRSEASELTRLFLVLVALSVLVSSTQAKYSGGSGTAEDPYRISTAADMNAIGADPCDWDKHFLLTADIDLGGYTGEMFNIIGDCPDNPFTGVFDGSGHTISNFTYGPTTRNFAGIFGYIDNVNAEIKDLGLVDPNFDGSVYWKTGPLVGWLKKGTVNNCYVKGGRVIAGITFGGLIGHSDGTVSNCYVEACNILGNNEYVGHISGGFGGLMGYNDVNGIISHCYSTCNITSTRSDGTELKIGGLVGCNVGGTIENSYAAGTVSASFTEQVGGLVGDSASGTITNCYATGSVSGNEQVGGLVGGMGSEVTASNCYSTGGVSGMSNVGGLIGYNSGGTVTASFWDTDTSGQDTSAGGTGMMTAEMQTRSTFTDVGWDFTGETANGTEDIWRLCVDLTDYPRFVWEKRLLGDFVCPDGSDFKDYAILAGQWQQASAEPSADIVPYGGDGIVDWLDLGTLCDNWLAGVE